jgi:ABC-2 type transport system permease protein
MIFPKRLLFVPRHWSILRDLSVKQFKAKYAGSFFGALWTFFNPLLLALAVAFVFSEILKVQAQHFYLFVIAGMLPWTFLATSLQEGASALVNNAPILKHAVVPRALFPLASVLTNLSHFLLALLAMLPFFFSVNPRLPLTLLWIAPVVFSQVLFVCGLALVFSAANARWRDVGQALGIILTFWLWMTPVFYGMEMVPPEYRLLFRINPMTAWVELYRRILLGGCAVDVTLLAANLLIGLATFFSGLFIFRKWEPWLLKRL